MLLINSYVIGSEMRLKKEDCFPELTNKKKSKSTFISHVERKMSSLFPLMFLLQCYTDHLFLANLVELATSIPKRFIVDAWIKGKARQLNADFQGKRICPLEKFFLKTKRNFHYFLQIFLHFSRRLKIERVNMLI